MAENQTESSMAGNKQSSGRSVFIKSPQTLNSFSGTAKAIMDELREKHKGIESSGQKKLHPLEFLTVDKIGESLLKYNNLSEQAKSNQAVDQALATLLDVKENGKERFVYLYPFLLKSSNKVASKIAVISPQTASTIDVTPYRDACFEFSKPMIDLILTNRAKKSKELDDANPGAALFHKNKQGQDWLYPERFSIESEINLLVKSGFKPYTYLPIKEFVEDFIEYGSIRKNLEPITSKYHIIVDEIQVKEDGSYIKQPEMVNHYRAQADGLEKFIMQYFPSLCDSGAGAYRNKISEFKLKFIDGAEPNRKQTREKVTALIALVKDFPFSQVNSELSKQVRETCDESTAILESLMNKMGSLISRKYDNIQDKLFKSVSNKIIEHCKAKMSLLPLNVEKEMSTCGIKEDDKLKDVRERLIKDILKQFPNKETKNASGDTVKYVVDHTIMASILHKYGMASSLTEDEKIEYEVAKQLNDELVESKNRRLNINIKPEIVAKMNEDLLKKNEAKDDKTPTFLTEFLKTLNPVPGILGFMGTVLVSAIIFLINEDFSVILMGFPAGIVIGILLAKFIQPKDGSVVVEKSASKGGEADNKTSQITKAASKFIYPQSFNSVTDKVYDKASLMKKIEKHMVEIKSGAPTLKDEADNHKVASAVEHAILNNSVVIAVPDNVAVKNKPNQLIISKNDFKAPTFRSQLSEVYREQMEKNKMNKELVSYYKFLVNILEVEYHKFLPKKGR